MNKDKIIKLLKYDKLIEHSYFNLNEDNLTANIKIQLANRSRK